MTDNEIVKALTEFRNTLDDGYSTAIEYGGKRDEWIEKELNLLCDAIDLINRLQTENERLSQFGVTLLRNGSKLFEEIQTAKAEAIKEFAERLKSRLLTVSYMNFDDVIDNLVKEMVGDTE